jgi:hypothetical protein
MTKPTVTKRATKTATAQRDAARRNRYEVLYERNLLLRLLCAQFRAHVAPATTATSPTDTWRWVVCLHTPNGNQTWKITDEEREMLFAALPERPDDAERHTHDQKIAALEDLVDLRPPVPW